MTFILREPQPTDGDAVIDILNFYIENGFAAFPDKPLPSAAYQIIVQMSKNLPWVIAENGEGTVVGFGLLKPYNPIATFSRTAELSYFIKPQYTGMGIGSAILEHLTTAGRDMGIRTLLACISKSNEGSINFHEKHGFRQVGHFKNVGMKHGKTFDIIWMQREEG